MAAGLGYKEFTTGDVLTAADANGYLASQVVMVFASAAARTSAIASPQEGMISYLKDTNSTEYYSGSAWAAIGGSSAKVVGIANTQTGTVATGTTQMPADNTIPQNTEGDQYMTLSYTPTSATNKLQIIVEAYGSCGANGNMSIALFRDTTANALAATTQYTVGGPTNNYAGTLSHTMTSGTTSAIAFKVRIGMDQPGTFTFNGRSGNQVFGGVGASSITITEYTP